MSSPVPTGEATSAPDPLGLVSKASAGGLAAISALSPEYRDIVVRVLRLRLTAELQPFLEADQHDVLMEFLYSVGGVIVGHVAEKVSLPQDEAPVRTPAPCGSIYEDMCIVMPGPDGLKRGMRWFRNRGYSEWRGRVLSRRGDPNSCADFVIGSRKEEHGPEKPAIIIAWGQSGIPLVTVAQPLNNAFSILAPYSLHRLWPLHKHGNHKSRTGFSFSSAPTVVESTDATPLLLLKVIFQRGVRNTECCEDCRYHLSLDLSQFVSSFTDIHDCT